MTDKIIDASKDEWKIGIGYTLSELIIRDDENIENMSVLFFNKNEADDFLKKHKEDIYVGNSLWKDILAISKNEKYQIILSSFVMDMKEEKAYKIFSPQICMIHPISLQKSKKETDSVYEKMESVANYLNIKEAYFFLYQDKDIIIDEEGEQRGCIFSCDSKHLEDDNYDDEEYEDIF